LLKVIEVITEVFEGIMGLLGALDGHGVYEKYGLMR
jgi:hypothetical protein